MPRFFSYDGNGGNNFEEHDTAEEAKAAAQSAIEYWTDDEPWAGDNVTGICWGEIREMSTIKNKREPTPEEKEEYPEWQFVADVVLEPIGSKQLTDDDLRAVEAALSAALSAIVFDTDMKRNLHNLYLRCKAALPAIRKVLDMEASHL